MSDTFGGNSQQILRSFIDRIEHVNSEIDDLRDDRRVIVAEAKAAGFEPKYIAHVVRKRKKKPHDRQEEETKEQMYMHAAGLASEPPLFRALNALAKDATSSEKILEAFKKMVPAKGEIITKIGGKRIRIFRDSEGVAQHEPYEEGETTERAPSMPPAKKKADVPDVDDDGAKALGRQYAKSNQPVTDNPFPFGDRRRAMFDQAWREETGSDGMGED